jgi:hypothetical protein
MRRVPAGCAYANVTQMKHDGRQFPQAALRRPLLEQDRALPVPPALEVAEQLVPLAGRRAIEFFLD